MAKLLIIRFSSFGDILQGLRVPAEFMAKYPGSEIHWAIREDFKELVLHNPNISKVWSLSSKDGLKGLFSLAFNLRAEKYTHVFDAHNNLRSRILSLFLWPSNFIRRPKYRIKRMMLFWFRKNYFDKPFRGQESYLKPLLSWEVKPTTTTPELYFSEAVSKSVQSQFEKLKPFIALVPSAAWAMKTWPAVHWKALIRERSDLNFVILGGAKDEVCHQIADAFKGSKNVHNFAGKLSILESCATLKLADTVVSADTGLLHAADLLSVRTFALIGPTAFGYPSSPTSKVFEVSLWCKPCSKDGRGKCINNVYQRCMVDILPTTIAKAL